MALKDFIPIWARKKTMAAREKEWKENKEITKKQKQNKYLTISKWMDKHVGMFLGQANGRTKEELIEAIPYFMEKRAQAERFSGAQEALEIKRLRTELSATLVVFRKMREAKGLPGMESYRAGNKWIWFIPEDSYRFETKRDDRAKEMWQKGQRVKVYNNFAGLNGKFKRAVDKAQEELERLEPVKERVKK
jgi:hypothetical protein